MRTVSQVPKDLVLVSAQPPGDTARPFQSWALSPATHTLNVAIGLGCISKIPSRADFFFLFNMKFIVKLVSIQHPVQSRRFRGRAFQKRVGDAWRDPTSHRQELEKRTDTPSPRTLSQCGILPSSTEAFWATLLIPLVTGRSLPHKTHHITAGWL